MLVSLSVAIGWKNNSLVFANNEAKIRLHALMAKQTFGD